MPLDMLLDDITVSFLLVNIFALQQQQDCLVFKNGVLSRESSLSSGADFQSRSRKKRKVVLLPRLPTALFGTFSFLKGGWGVWVCGCSRWMYIYEADVYFREKTAFARGDLAR